MYVSDEARVGNSVSVRARLGTLNWDCYRNGKSVEPWSMQCMYVCVRRGTSRKQCVSSCTFGNVELGLLQKREEC